MFFLWNPLGGSNRGRHKSMDKGLETDKYEEDMEGTVKGYNRRRTGELPEGFCPVGGYKADVEEEIAGDEEKDEAGDEGSSRRRRIQGR